MIAEGADDAVRRFEMRKDRGDAVGVAISAGDQVAGHDDHVRLKFVDPIDELQEIFFLVHNQVHLL